MIQDQYEEEYFVSFLSENPNYQKINGSSGTNENSPGKPDGSSKSKGLVYKYYYDLTDDEM